MISEASSARSGASLMSDLARNFVRDCVQQQVLLNDEAHAEMAPMTSDRSIISNGMLNSQHASSPDKCTPRPASCEQAADVISPSTEQADVLSPSTEHADGGSDVASKSAESSSGWAVAMAETILHSSNSKPLAELSAAWAKHMVDQVGQMLNGDETSLGDCPQLMLDFSPSALSTLSRPGTARADDAGQETTKANDSRPVTPSVTLHVTSEPNDAGDGSEAVLSEKAKAEAAACLLTGPSTTRSNICSESNEVEEPDSGAEHSVHCVSEHLEANPKSSRSVTYASENLETDLSGTTGLKVEHLAGEKSVEVEEATPRSPSQYTTASFALQPETSRSICHGIENFEAAEPPTSANAHEAVEPHEDLAAEPPSSRSIRRITECSATERGPATLQCEDDCLVEHQVTCPSVHDSPGCLVAQPPTSRSIRSSCEGLSTQPPTSRSINMKTSEEGLATQPQTSRSIRNSASARSPAEEKVEQHGENDSATNKVSQLFKEMCKNDIGEPYTGPEDSPEQKLSSEERQSILTKELAKLNDMASGLADVALGLDATAEKLSSLNGLAGAAEQENQPTQSAEDDKIAQESSHLCAASEIHAPLESMAKAADTILPSASSEVAEAASSTTRSECKNDEKHATCIPVFEAKSCETPRPSDPPASKKIDTTSASMTWEAEPSSTPITLDEKIDTTPPAVKFEIIVPSDTPRPAVIVEAAEATSNNVLTPAESGVAQTKFNGHTSSTSKATDLQVVSKGSVLASSKTIRHPVPQRRCEAIDLSEEAGEAAQWGSLKFSQESQRTKNPSSSLPAAKGNHPCLTLSGVLASAASLRPPSRSGKDSSVDPIAELRSIAQSAGNAPVANVLEQLLPHVTNQLRDVLSEAVKQSIAKELQQYTIPLENQPSPSAAKPLNDDEADDSYDPQQKDCTWQWGRIVTACMAREAERLRQSEERETLQRALREATDQNKFTQRDGRLQNVLFASQASWQRQQRFELLQEIEHVQMAWEDERAHMAREMERTINGTMQIQGMHFSEASCDAATVRLCDLLSVEHLSEHANPEPEEVHDKWTAMAWPTSEQEKSLETASVESDDVPMHEAHQDSITDADSGIHEDEVPEASQHTISEDRWPEETTAMDSEEQCSTAEMIPEADQEVAVETSHDQPSSLMSSRAATRCNSPSKDLAYSNRSSPAKNGGTSLAKKHVRCVPESPCKKAGSATNPENEETFQVQEGQVDSLPFYTPPPKDPTHKKITLKSMCERSNDMLEKKREEIETMKEQMKQFLAEGQNDVARALDRKVQTAQSDLWRLEDEHMKLNEQVAWQSQMNSESENAETPNSCSTPSGKTPTNLHPQLEDLIAIGDRTPVEELEIAEQSPALSARSVQSVRTDSEDEQSEREHEQPSSAATTSRDHENASSAASTAREHEQASSAASSSRDINTMEHKALGLIEQRENEIRRLQDQILKNESLDAHKLVPKELTYDKPLSYKSQKALPLGDLRKKLDTEHALRVRNLPKRAVGGSYPAIEKNDFQMAQPMPPKPARCSPKETSEFPSLKRCGSQPKTSGNAVRMLPPQPTFALQGGDPRAMPNYEFDDRQSGRNESGRSKKKEKRVSAREFKHRSKLDVLGSMYAPLLAPAEANRHHLPKVQSLPSLRPAGCIY
jgi:hypothetical protein